MRWLALASLMLALAPPVQGQAGVGHDLTLTLSEPQAVVESETRVAVHAVVTARCEAIPAHLNPQASETAVLVKVTWRLPETILLEGVETLAIPVAACAGALEATVEQDYVLVLRRDTPGLKSIQVDVAAAWSEPRMTDRPQAPQRLVLSAAYQSLSEVRIVQNAKTCSCDLLTFDIDVTNLGNARTQYNFEVASRPDGASWDIQLPDPLILDSAYSGGAGKTSGHAVVQVAVGGGEGDYAILVRPAAADQPDQKGEPILVNLRARSEQPVPGLEAPTLLLGVAALALLARRRA